MELWSKVPGTWDTVPEIVPYLPEKKRGRGAVVIFPGGGYTCLAPHEGEGYARFLADNGVAAFVVNYRVAPHRYPLPLLDARRGVRWVRYHGAEYGVDPDKIAVMGSSAGGHLAAVTAVGVGVGKEEITDEIDRADFRPNAQILCYPVICPPTGDGVSHGGSYFNLIGGTDARLEQKLDPIRSVSDSAPPAFIWHTADDDVVNVENSLRYATALRRRGVPVELHVFPHGPHGMGLAESDPTVNQWTGLLLRWLETVGWR